MCDCQPEIGYVCGSHTKQREQERRERAVALSQIECPQCREQARRKFEGES